SRLYRALVIERHLAVSAGASADTSGIGGGSFSLFATPAESVSLETLEAAMDDVVRPFLPDGPTEAELTRPKSHLEAAAVYARDDSEQIANIFGSSLAQGESIDQIVTWPDRIDAVTHDSALTALRAALDINASVTGYLLPGEHAQ